MKKNLLLALSVGAALAAGPLAATAAPEISSKVNVTDNKAKNITSAGGGLSVGIGPIKGGKLEANGTANVNSLVVYEGKVKGNINISKNEADDVKALGSTANVNSLILVQAR